LTASRLKAIGNQKGTSEARTLIEGGKMKPVLAVMLLMITAVVFAETNPSLATVLTPDGRIMEGVSGSFDPTGFCMTYGPDGEPLFMEEGSPPWESVPLPYEQDSEGAWYPLGTGVSAIVYDIDMSDTGLLYAGGTFTYAGGSEAYHIACWDGSSWHAMGKGSGVSNTILSVAASGSDVYVGGIFTVAGGMPANRIARWDGSSWHALGLGVSGGSTPYVWAIAVSGSDVYVGGTFTVAGGMPANRIARWDGSSWHALGSGLNHFVYTIAVNGSDVFAGGVFTQAGGTPASRIARWDGTSWHALGSGIGANSPYVYAIAVSGSDVYVGGTFTQAGGNPASNIARWDGSSWHALGSGLNSTVFAIAVGSGDVYAGGVFTEAGGNPANRIARWDGTSWHPLGGGVNHHVRSAVLSGPDVYVGGDFTQAGGNSSYRIARWVTDPVGTQPPMGEVFPGESPSLWASPNPLTEGTNLSFQSLGPSPLTLEIYDTAGRPVKTHNLGALPVGSHSHYWDGRDGNGSPLVSGVYFVRLSSLEQQTSTRVVLVR
jgi:hypothetical protein